MIQFLSSAFRTLFHQRCVGPDQFVAILLILSLVACNNAADGVNKQPNQAQSTAYLPYGFSLPTSIANANILKNCLRAWLIVDGISRNELIVNDRETNFTEALNVGEHNFQLEIECIDTPFRKSGDNNNVLLVSTPIPKPFTLENGNNYFDFNPEEYVFTNNDTDKINNLNELINGTNPFRVITANAGRDKSTQTRSLTQLDGSQSSNPDPQNNNTIFYQWSIDSQPNANQAITLSNPTAVNPTFTPDIDGQFVFSLVVTDSNGNRSESDSVTITATTGNIQPTANAGENQYIVLGSDVTLNGSSSSDPENNIITYAWTITSKPPTSGIENLKNPNSVMPEFTPDIIGEYTISLIVNDGNNNSIANSITITVGVGNLPPTAVVKPTTITALVNEMVTVDGSLSTDPNNDILLYSWTFLSVPTKSLYLTQGLTNATTVNPNFIPDVTGTYVISLVVRDSQLYSIKPGLLTVNVVAGNRPPIAISSLVPDGRIGQLITLDGSASYDPDGDAITFLWIFVTYPGNAPPELSGQTVAKPNFTANLAGTYVFALQVEDSNMAINNTQNSITTVTITADNRTPICNAGQNQNTLLDPLGNTTPKVILDGSASFDPDGEPITYRWSLGSKPVTSKFTNLINPSSVKPSFIPDVEGTYTFSLLVNDGSVDCVTASVVSVTATSDNPPPTANAGLDQNVIIGSQVTLDASGSSDPTQENLTFLWTVNSAPVNTTLANATSISPSFTPTVDGTYVIQLVVNDGVQDSTNTDFVVINVAVNPPPTANAGLDQIASVGDLVKLNGTASSDANNDPLTYAWTIISTPQGSSVTINNLMPNPNEASPQFTADSRGTYVFSLLVNDGSSSSAVDLVIINIVLGSEGTSTTPLPLTLADMPYSGSVSTTTLASYYTISGFTAGSVYTGAITNLEANADLFFYSDSSFTQILCALASIGTVNETCQFSAISSVVFLKVPISSAASGTPFLLSIIAGATPTDPISEGRINNPVVLAFATADLPRSGTVGISGGGSYYKVNGLSTLVDKTISITGLSDDANLQVYSDATFTTLLCSSTIIGLTDESCSTVSTNGTLYIHISNQNISAGSFFTLNVTAPAGPSEGTQVLPLTLDIATLPYRGSVSSAASSYYQVTGLTNLTNYAVEIQGYTEDADLIVYADSGFSNSLCSSSSSGPRDVCAAMAASDSLYVLVDKFFVSNGTYFSLNLSQIPTTFVSEGDLNSPISIDLALLPYRGSVSGTTTNTRSYYAITGLTASAFYSFSLTDLIDDAELSVFSDSRHTRTLCQSFNSGIDPEICTSPVTSATVYVRVDKANGIGTVFNLDVILQP